jgi:tetratricopeptide (TPR) repeat protein
MKGLTHTRALTIGAMALALAAFAAPALAQTGQIKGKVVDAQNKPVDGAQITIQEQGGQNRKYQTRSNRQGEYQQIGIPPGKFTVQADKDKLSQAFDVSVSVGDTKEVNFALKPGVAEDVEKRRTAMQAKYNEAGKLSNAGQHDEAIKLVNEILAEIPQCAECYVTIGAINERKKDLAAAEAAYKKSIEINPNSPTPYQALAGVYNQQQKFKEAGEMAAEADKRAAAAPGAAGGGGGSAESLYNRAVIAFNAADYKKAEETLSAALKADPNHAEAHFLRGNVLVQLGVTSNDLSKFGEAAAEFETYIKLAPNGPNAEKAKKQFEELKSFKK